MFHMPYSGAQFSWGQKSVFNQDRDFIQQNGLIGTSVEAGLKSKGVKEGIITEFYVIQTTITSFLGKKQWGWAVKGEGYK